MVGLIGMAGWAAGIAGKAAKPSKTWMQVLAAPYKRLYNSLKKKKKTETEAGKSIEEPPHLEPQQKANQKKK
jgi:hypothetical protein